VLAHFLCWAGAGPFQNQKKISDFLAYFSIHFG